jgi:hypothetical protein
VTFLKNVPYTFNSAVLNQNLTEKKKSIYEIMKFFKATPRTESAFYLRFQKMSKEDIRLLMSYYYAEEDWQVFKRICKFWNVR